MSSIAIFETNPAIIDHWCQACDEPPVRLHEPAPWLQPVKTAQVLLMQYLGEHSALQIQLFAEHGRLVVVFSPSPNDAEALQVYQNGAKGYLHTYSHPEQIQQAILTVRMGGVWLEEQHMQAMMSILFEQAQTPPVADWKSVLTDREIDVVYSLLDGKSNKEIAAAMQITERTVKAHLQNIFQKMGVKDRLELVLAIHNP